MVDSSPAGSADAKLSRAQIRQQYGIGCNPGRSRCYSAVTAEWSHLLYICTMLYAKENRNFDQSFINMGGHSLLQHMRRRTEPFFGIMYLNRLPLWRSGKGTAYSAAGHLFVAAGLFA